MKYIVPKLKINKDDIRRVGTDYIVMVEHKLFLCDSCGYEIMILIDGKKTIEDILKSLGEIYNIKSIDLKNDVKSFLKNLANNDIIYFL